jgi:hypothetical protein
MRDHLLGHTARVATDARGVELDAAMESPGKSCWLRRGAFARAGAVRRRKWSRTEGSF